MGASPLFHRFVEATPGTGAAQHAILIRGVPLEEPARSPWQNLRKSRRAQKQKKPVFTGVLRLASVVIVQTSLKISLDFGRRIPLGAILIASRVIATWTSCLSQLTLLAHAGAISTFFPNHSCWCPPRGSAPPTSHCFRAPHEVPARVSLEDPRDEQRRLDPNGDDSCSQKAREWWHGVFIATRHH